MQHQVNCLLHARIPAIAEFDEGSDIVCVQAGEVLPPVAIRPLQAQVPFGCLRDKRMRSVQAQLGAV